MSASQARAAGAYRQTSVQSSSPLELVVLLYDGALRHLTAARAASVTGDGGGRRVAFSRLLAILIELQSTLNVDRGGEIARSLDGLYAYMITRVTEANRRRDVTPLDEVERLLRSLRDAWAQIAAPQAATGTHP